MTSAPTTDDIFVVTTLGNKIFVSGLDAEVSIDHAGKTDILSITGGLGNDLIDASALPAGKILLDLLGNSNNDTIIGSAGNDKVLEAGGDDQLFLGAGNDVVEWNGSAGDDIIEGGSGVDSFLLSAIDEFFAIGANGGRALLTRSDGASIDMDDVERIQFSASSAAAFLNVRTSRARGFNCWRSTWPTRSESPAMGRAIAFRSTTGGTTRSARPSAKAWSP